jgi:Carboxypeptidase regulatory-like domain
MSRYPIASLAKSAVRRNAGKALQVLATALAVLLLCVPAFSQGNAGRISGTIMDQTGGAIAGATVTVTDTQRGVSRTLTTDQSGAYSAPNVIPGTYTVKAEAKGFKTIQRENVLVQISQDIRVDATLQPGEQQQTITVTEAVPMVETTNASLGGTVTNQTINELPLNGRNYQNLLSLRPGVQIYPGGGAWSQSSNGMRAHDNVYMVEGINHSDPWLAQSIINAVGFAGDAATILSMDAIQEFKTEQNPRAEFGWKPGSQVNVGLKSGTNTIHGTAFAFGRTDAWDARNYYNTDIKSDPSCATDPLPCTKQGIAMQQFGGTAGGPIVKDKLFWFGDYEGQRYTLDSGWIGTAPITTAGVFTDPLNPAASNLISACQNAGGAATALSLHLAGMTGGCGTPSGGFFPLNSGSNGVNYPTGLVSTNTSDSGLGKIDFHINDKNTMSGTFFHGSETGIFADAVTLMQPYWRSLLVMGATTGNVNWTFTPNSTTVNEIRFGYARFNEAFLSVDHDVNAFTGYGINTGVTNPDYFGAPDIFIRGQFSSGFQLGGEWPKSVGPDTVMQFTDHVSILKGTHSFKFGADLLANTSENNVTARAKGDFRFNNLTDFFTGTLNRARLTIGDAKRNLSNYGFGVFLQDDWRIRPRLTLNLGVRYEINTVIRERNNLEGNFDPILGAVQVGNQIPNPYNGDHNNFSPRVGFAWDMFGNGKTVLRGGGTLMYESLTYDAFMALGNLVGLRTVPTGAINCVGATCAAPTGSIAVTQFTLTGGALGPVNTGWANNSANSTIFPNLQLVCSDTQRCTVPGVDYNIKTPYVVSWNFGIQRQIGNNLSLDVSYVGNHGTKLIQWNDINNPGVGAGYSAASLAACVSPASAAAGYNQCGASGALEAAARPFNSRFPYYNYIEVLGNHDSSNYNGLQVTLNSRNWHGLSMTTGYTYSHAIDVASDNWGGGSGSGIFSDGNPRNHYGNSSFDITHRFTLSATYNIPGIKTPGQLLEGWSINNIVSLQGGQPYNLYDLGNDISGTGEINATGAVGEPWNFFGPKSAFNATHGLTPSAANFGNGGIPYFAGASNADCVAQTGGAGTLSYAALVNFGCYAMNGGVLTPPAFGTIGNSGKGIFRGSGFHNWDVSVTKAFKFGDRLSTQFRAEFFNVLNHPEFVNPEGGPAHFQNNDPSTGDGMGYGSNTPDVAATNPVFGSGGARSIQLGLKIIF